MLFNEFINKLKEDSETYIKRDVLKMKELHDKLWEYPEYHKHTFSEIYSGIIEKCQNSEKYQEQLQFYKEVMFPEDEARAIYNCNRYFVDMLIPINKKYIKYYNWEKYQQKEIEKGNKKIDEFAEKVNSVLIENDDCLDESSEIYIDYTKSDNQRTSIISHKKIRYQFYVIMVSGCSIRKPHIRLLTRKTTK